MVELVPCFLNFLEKITSDSCLIKKSCDSTEAKLRGNGTCHSLSAGESKTNVTRFLY